MIIKGSERGGAKQLALHLMNTQDNDHVELHKVHGCIAQDIEGALMEIYAVSRATNCTNPFFSVSLSPPKYATPTVADYEAAVDRIAQHLGLDRQSYILLFHEKAGRRHAHVVFSRIDLETMKAINLHFYKDRLNEIAHELFLAHGWDLPKGFENRALSSPTNYGLTEYHEGKKAGRDVERLKKLFLDCWQGSDSRKGFEAALQEHGIYLCQGTRRGFVLLDESGNIYSLSRWLGEKPKALTAKLGSPDDLPTIEQVKAKIEITVDEDQKRHVESIPIDVAESTQPLEKQRQRLVEKQRQEREALADKFAKQRDREITAYNNDKRRGLAGLWDVLSGAQKQKKRDLATKLDALTEGEKQQRHELSCRHLREIARLQINFDRVKLWAEKQRDVSGRELVAERVQNDPAHVLSLLTDTKSVFTRNDIVRKLGDYINDPQAFQHALSTVFAAPSLVHLVDPQDTQSGKVWYSTWEMVEIERGLIRNAENMAQSKSHGVRSHLVSAAINRQDQLLKKSAGAELSAEQRRAIEHVTDDKRIAAVVGLAGAGKSTMLSAARDAWERQGYRVFGAALAGKAADGLQQSSGITSRTLASYELSWKNGLHQLQKNDVLVIDEAGMVGSKQLARFISAANKAGAKIVLVGDPDQLQPINAGAPFRAITDKIGFAELSTIHRQRHEWQRNASHDFARGKMESGLRAYDEHGAIHFAETNDDAKINLAADYMVDWEESGAASSRLALAHRRKDVKALNKLIREMRKLRGDLQGEIAFETAHGNRPFAEGDRILFTKNDRTLGVKNGTLGTVEQIGDSILTVKLDQSEQPNNTITVTIQPERYPDFDHGYATTIHKAQGATVDSCFVLASRTMDRNLAYVAMTRHKVSMKLYPHKKSFTDTPSLAGRFGRYHLRFTTLEYQPSQESNRNPEPSSDSPNRIPQIKHRF